LPEIELDIPTSIAYRISPCRTSWWQRLYSLCSTGEGWFRLAITALPNTAS